LEEKEELNLNEIDDVIEVIEEVEEEDTTLEEVEEEDTTMLQVSSAGGGALGVGEEESNLGQGIQVPVVS